MKLEKEVIQVRMKPLLLKERGRKQEFLAGSLRESFVHECLKAYRKSVLWPRTAVRRRHAARAGAAGIAHVVYVLILMHYHSHSRANGRVVGPESHRRPSGAAAERAPRASR